MQQKHCSACGELKEFGEYNRDAGILSGIRANCRDCENKRERNKYESYGHDLLCYVVRISLLGATCLKVGETGNLMKRLIKHRLSVQYVNLLGVMPRPHGGDREIHPYLAEWNIPGPNDEIFMDRPGVFTALEPFGYVAWPLFELWLYDLSQQPDSTIKLRAPSLLGNIAAISSLQIQPNLPF